MSLTPCQALVARVPYLPGAVRKYDPTPIFEQAARIDKRGLICLSVPIHAEAPEAPFRLLLDLERGVPDPTDPEKKRMLHQGLKVVSVAAWYRDRHIVVVRSRRLSNTWEPLFILAKGDDYVFDRDAATKVKKGFEGREGAFDEDEYRTCIGDHWPLRNDLRDRRYLPAQAVLNCGQLAGLQPGDRVLDPWGNPGIKEACQLLGWQYVDGEAPSQFRPKAPKPKLQNKAQPKQEQKAVETAA